MTIHLAQRAYDVRGRIARTVNTAMIRAYWFIGREIVEVEQHGEDRAGYGEQLLEGLAERLTMENEVLSERSPLFGRRTAQMLLRPMTCWKALELDSWAVCRVDLHAGHQGAGHGIGMVEVVLPAEPVELDHVEAKVQDPHARYADGVMVSARSLG